MARNPYAVRRDHTWPRRIALVVAGLTVLLLLAVYVLRPARSPAADARAAALEAQIDASEAASDRERALDAERRAGSF
jgi:hypothetical protein